eukprot:scaffold28217_cov65-Skeletonema_dohrnii-CCMP3373.AAC.2
MGLIASIFLTWSDRKCEVELLDAWTDESSLRIGFLSSLDLCLASPQSRSEMDLFSVQKARSKNQKAAAYCIVACCYCCRAYCHTTS